MPQLFKEFIAPFPQKETVKMETPAVNPPEVYFPDPEVKTDKGRMITMKVDFSGIYSARNKFNIIKDFELLRNTRNYISEKHEKYFGEPYEKGKTKRRVDDFFSRLNHKGDVNPQELINQWKNLEGLIPGRYFDIIEAEPGVLDCMLEADAEEYMRVLNSRPEISCFVVRYMSCMYKGFEMPATNDEQYAINYIRAFQLKMPFRCCINILDVKSIYVELDGVVKHCYYYPELRMEGDFFRFTGSNKNNCMVKGIEEGKEFGLGLFKL